jgi:PAS domain S-box-containing protein
MTTLPLGIPFSQDARDLGAAAVATRTPSGTKPSGYVLVPLREAADFTLYRGRQQDNPSPVLVVALAAEHPSPQSLRRLEHEYSLAGEVDSAWAAKPLALTRHEGRAILVLKDPGGDPLDLILERGQGQPLDLTRALRIAIGLTTALCQVHRHGLIHKDIKPENVLVDDADCVWLTGFGVASRLPRELQPPAPPEIISGTLAYMAPEQTGRMNRSVDARSDFYSLGVTLYLMLTGALPFDAADPLEWVHCHIARRPRPPRDRAAVPEPLSAIVMKLLAKNAEDRYQTALGVEADLQKCFGDWESRGCIEPFQLGTHDVPNQLLIPEKLYGREREVDALLAAFERVVAGGRPELVLVSGYSGIGKSAVVNELRKSLVPPRGLFASGKFDQYKRDIPYATVAQAFQSLLRPLMSKLDGQLSKWRDDLLLALSPNGSLLIDLVPELKLIIGEQSPVAALPPQDAKTRSYLAFRRFISVFARPEHPLVLFLDDLQWLDVATLDFLEDLLVQQDLAHLLVVGAYRDNEVDSAHPLMRKLSAIRQAGAAEQEIRLTPLSPADLAHLIADALHCESQPALLLAQLLHEKTSGNPFFVRQFIHALVEEGLITFDHRDARWRWDLDAIRAKGYTDNVVDLMVAKLNRLPVAIQKALQQFACIGNSAEAATLSAVLEASEQETEAELWEALHQELIVRSENSYRFAHDRIQEAAYSLIAEEARAEAHLRIGRLLHAHTPPEKREEAVFEIVNQLNRGAELIVSEEERFQVAELNLIAGKRAKGSTAYASALQYFVAGQALLTDAAWERNHDLIFQLELQRAECEFLTGELAIAAERVEMLRSRASNTVELAMATCLGVDVYMAISQTNRAIAIGLDYLHHLGIDWPLQPTEEQVRSEYERIWSRLGSREIEKVMDFPLMSDPTSIATLDVLTKVLSSAMFTDTNLFALVVCGAVSLSIEHGNNDGSCVHYVWLSFVAGHRFGDYKNAFRFAQLGYDLVEKRGLKRFQAATYAAFANGIMPWMQHLSACCNVTRQAFEIAKTIGDLTYAAYSRISLNTLLIATGDPLAEVQWEVENGLRFAQKAKIGFATDMANLQLCLIRTLRGLTTKFGSFEHAEFDEIGFERRLESYPPAAHWGYWVRKLQAHFFAGDFASAIEASLKARPLLATLPNFAPAEYEFYSALARAAFCDCATAAQSREHYHALEAHYKQLQIWAENCPENFENRAALVGAEIARIEGRMLDAEKLYEDAIRSAQANGFVHNEALANELAAGFYRARGLEKVAKAYLKEARSLYARWGADGKVKQLDELYPRLRDERTHTSSTAIAPPVGQLDVETVVKASQALSSEMVLSSLIEKLVRIAVEHAGAERGLLILIRDREPRIEAEATTGPGRIEMVVRQEQVTPSDLPQSALHYVIRTQESVLLDDASADDVYSKDEYVRQNRSRSILCLPIVERAQLVGALYLENNLTACAFTPDRVAVLQFLASQAAISLENASLYSDLQRSEAFLTEGQSISHTGSFGWSVASGEIYWSAETYNIFELDRAVKPTLEMILPRFHPDDKDLVQQTLDRACEAKADFDLEHRLLMPDGSIKHLHISARVLTTSSGNLEFVGAVTDITAAKQAEEKSRRDDHELRHIADAIAQVIVVLGPNGRPVYANRVALEYTGLSIEEVRAESFRDRVVHPEDTEMFKEVRQNALLNGVPFETEQRVLGKDGKYRWFLLRYNPFRDEEGRLVRWYATAVDIEDRKVAEQRIQNENVTLREEIDRFSMFEEIVGSCEPMRQVLKQVAKVAPSGSTVLILGETGTGKELIARALHRRSNRAARAFVRVNCAAIPQSLIASELFGHEKGAFTGALQRRLGRFESADGGTLFLDEIGDLPMETQIALLRVLQEREFERVGSNHPIPVDVRLIAATNRDLPAAVAAGTFRQDLFYRLHVVPIVVPPLRERAADIPLLVEYFVGRYAKAAGKKIRHIGRQTLEQLTAYGWPGNIRELQNVVERAVILGETDTFFVDESWLKRESAESRQPREGLSTPSDREVGMIEAAIVDCHGRISGPSGAAAKLGIPRQTLESKIRRLKISKYGLKHQSS